MATKSWFKLAQYERHFKLLIAQILIA